jgi:hypothetical protein
MASEVNRSMDLTQAMQTIRWLDEERRKDKISIATLEERLKEQQQGLSQLAARVKDLQTAVVSLQDEKTQVQDFEQLVANYKNELVLLMDQREESRRKEQSEGERLRRIEYEALTSNLKKLEKELRVLPRYNEELEARRTEEQRLGEVVQRLSESVVGVSKRYDDRLQTIPYLEERRRVDSRRIDELESEATELRRRIDAVGKKLPLLEENIQKQKPLIEVAMREVRKYEKPIEELRVADFQREQKMRQYLDQGELVVQELDRVRQQTTGFLEQQQAVKRALDKLELFEGRIDTRQNEMGERQRLAEEQVRRQWEAWQVKQEKQQKKHGVVTQERWSQQRKVNDGLVKRIDAIPPMLDLHHQQLERLWEVRRDDATASLKSAQDVYDTYTAPIEDQLSVLRAARKE